MVSRADLMSPMVIMAEDYILTAVPTRETDDRRLLPFFVVLLFLLCAAMWSLVVPPFEAPDEPGHARYVNFLIEHHRLPLAGEEAPGEAHQPPLYYGLAAAAAAFSGLGMIDVAVERNPAFRWYGGTSENKYLHAESETPPLGGSARVLHRLRLLFVVLGGITVLLIYATGRRAGLPPDRAAMAAALAAFIPQFTFISGTLNNDNLANVLAAACLACLVAGVTGRSGRGGLGAWVGAGLLAGFGTLTKFTGLAMIPCGLVALALARGSGSRALASKAAAFLAPALCLPIPLLVRNALVMGDPLGAGAQVATLPQLLDRKSLLSAYFVSEFPTVLFTSFWGVFGWMSFRLPAYFYMVCLLITLGGLLGLLFDRGRIGAAGVGRLFGAVIAVQVAQVVVYNMTFTQAQGRFLFPVLGPIAIALGVGLTGGLTGRLTGAPAGRLAPGWRGWPYVLIGLLAAGNLCILRFVVLPGYRAAAGPA